MTTTTTETTTAIARCPGWGDGPEDWLDECEGCQRRTAPPGPNQIAPPLMVTLECESYIPPDPARRGGPDARPARWVSTTDAND